MAIRKPWTGLGTFEVSKEQAPAAIRVWFSEQLVTFTGLKGSSKMIIIDRPIDFRYHVDKSTSTEFIHGTLICSEINTRKS